VKTAHSGNPIENIVEVLKNCEKVGIEEVSFESLLTVPAIGRCFTRRQLQLAVPRIERQVAWRARNGYFYTIRYLTDDGYDYNY